MKKENFVWISMGSNLCNPFKQINEAINNIIFSFPHTKLLSCSSYYRSKPLGLKNQPDFLNVVVLLKTFLSPEMLLKNIQLIELKQGRVRTLKRWESRTLDIDILLFGNCVINTKKLIVPHYDMKNRSFVLYPLFELMPNFSFPDGTCLLDCIKSISLKNLTYWE
ncbi:2-amino-4-hydroxy-6-hydroxymethyldihydropteridinepyrophosphokinase [Candidatus Westeberhardia cardiocondylae]|uniref:2-amino-4-hydroxy-6-hydroxymethyldihydropteridine pyrophosphokinase n=1 Tax=Candidatus Westeberhardia cardiocondylae TaxID=1594731 RepID=A0A0H5C558_9ENTR|nr:2-amino-4-hydroxy-6-hydroxymethyldihydropteridine diphosphokinase [Candidatus Westeberhardia cardiocondylae]MCR3756256.1 2-amino-4-hydroxy-6- hydroxymethyldihydropteridine diphosphokinase [Candidatus Westeberhardia cardiocondylae]CEN32096.1 2-amino-4-hydroxy-6-hydroxymethyldihydropteridinepyrophosphokinase [Candidatus Westeberhardia cardiocondylae]